MTDSPERFFTPPEIAKILRVRETKVLGWIRSTELRAVNVGTKIRPRYRISREQFDQFVKLHEVQAPGATQRPQLPKLKRPEGGPLDPKLGKELEEKGQAKKMGKHYYRVWNGMTLYY